MESGVKGWNIAPGKDITTGSWKNQGLPFYSESVKYTKIITVDKSGEYELKLPKWNGTVAEVFLNGESAGIIQTQPYTKELSLRSR